MANPPRSDDDRRARLLAAMPAIAWSASVETFRFNYVSPAAETILGYPAERWIEEPAFWTAHLHPDDQHVARFCHNETLACRDHELVYRMIAADGHTVWLRDYVNVHVVDGLPVELFGVMVDITREREAEIASRENRENFRRMVELSPDCIGVHVDGRYVYVNQAFVQLLGAASEAEIVGRDILSFVDAELHDDVRSRMERARAGECVPYVRRKYRRIDGSPIDVEAAALPLRYGNRDAVQVIARDITEAVLVQRALEQSEQRYRELVEDVTDILYTLDQEGRFVSLSRSFERSTGYHIDDWIGRHFSDLFMPHSVPLAVEHFEQTLAGNGRMIREYDLVAKSGAVVAVEVSSQPRYVDGIVAGTIGMARDVTEQRCIARKLEESKRMSSLGQVAASLAHEFNNVLMGIQPFVNVISRSGRTTPDVREALGHITRAISRGKRASQEILRFANPKEPQLFPVDVRTWLPTLVDQLEASLPSSVALTCSIDPEAGFIRGDAEHLDQVITNLVFNARDAIRHFGTIEVRAALDGDSVRISVCDDGCGIPAGMLDQIFDPLFTTKRNGTGLGLAIARRLIEAHGGTLAAENRPGGGAVFHVRVPSAEAPLKAVEPLACATPGVRRILLVEDDLSVGIGLEKLLKSEGYETTWVRAAAEVRDAALRTHPQVAIIDVNLPDGNGVDLIPVLRTDHQDLPIVLSTGHVELDLTDDRNRILSLMKPYELEELLSAIGSVTAA
jgi:PAS domain S-box-containing protein